jgi:hypothetical protein
LISSNQQLQTELQRVREDNENFKREMRLELANAQGQSPTSTSVQSDVGISLASLSPPTSSNPSAPHGNGTSSSTELQAQMVAVLNDTFSKLSLVIQDTRTNISESKSSETKTDWVKFSGDPKKFCSWYLAIMAQLSIPPWQDLYDSTTSSMVKVTSNYVLNGKLYAKVIGALDGSALQHMLAHKHLRANGILLLQDLHQMYTPKAVPELLAAKTAEFWGSTKCLPSESIDNYYNRFQELLEELNEDVEIIPIQSEIHQFIFTLGTEFEPLQMNFRLGTLASEWQTEDWPTLLVLCRNFYNSVNPRGPTTTAKRDRDPFLEFGLDRSSHHKKVRNWFMNPTKNKTEIASEQQKYPGRCIYHLTKSHGTADCQVKKECDTLLLSKRISGTGNGSQTSSSNISTGQLRHITEKIFEDAVALDDVNDDSCDHMDNNTNESDLLYFASVSNHYL